MENYTLSKDIQINKVENSANKEEKYFLEVNNRQYIVGELIYSLIKNLQQELTLADICNDVNNKFKPNPILNEKDIKKIIEKNIKPLGVFEAGEIVKKNKTSIKARIT